MPFGGLLTTSLISAGVSATVGAIEASKQRKLQSDIANRNITAEKQIATQNQQTELTAAESKNLADIITSAQQGNDALLATVMSHEIDSQATANAAAINADAIKQAAIYGKTSTAAFIIAGVAGVTAITLYIIHKNK